MKWRSFQFCQCTALLTMLHHRLIKLLLVASLVVTGCDNSASGSSPQALAELRLEEVSQQLQGSWLREYGTPGLSARRLLVLETDGTFRETVHIADAATGQLVEQIHVGTWLYDGTNLKRKYLQMNGKPPSRLNLPFITLELRFESKNEFIGLDRVHKNEARYRRVQPETTL